MKHLDDKTKNEGFAWFPRVARVNRHYRHGSELENVHTVRMGQNNISVQTKGKLTIGKANRLVVNFCVKLSV